MIMRPSPPFEVAGYASNRRPAGCSKERSRAGHPREGATTMPRTQVVGPRMMGDTEIGQHEGTGQFCGCFLDGQPVTAEPFLEVSIQPMLCPCRVGRFMNQDAGMRGGALESRMRRHKYLVKVDAVVGVVGVDNDWYLQSFDEGVGMDFPSLLAVQLETAPQRD